MKGCVNLAEKLQASADQLTARARAGDREAFDELIGRFEAKVLRLAYFLTRNWHDAEDVAQDVYVKLVQKAPKMQTWDNLEAWVMQVTANAARDLLRRRRRWIPLVQSADRRYPARELEGREFRSRLFASLGSLSFAERAAFVLRDLQEFSTAEVAEVLGCRPATVRGYLLTARRKLRQRFEEWRRR